jgi:hypothetical protein
VGAAFPEILLPHICVIPSDTYSAAGYILRHSMRPISNIFLFTALLVAVLGIGWNWFLGLLTTGLILRPGLPWLGILIGGIQTDL